MSLEEKAGPIGAIGQLPPMVAGNPPPDYNSDRAPSYFDLGWGIPDPRYTGAGASGWMNPSGEIGGTEPNPLRIVNFAGAALLSQDQAPSSATTANIAALQDLVAGTAMTLVSSSGAGITVMTAALTIPQTGKTVPSGSLCIDTLPALISFGQTGAIAVPDPRTMVARAVSFTGVSGGTGGNVLVAGYDMYGQPQTELVALPTGAATANGKKGWKFIASATPQTGVDASHTYSMGTADIFEFAYRVDELGYADMTWANALVTTTTFVAADTTSPATSSTGSVRGTWTPPSSSNGTKAMQVFVSPSPYNLATLTSTSVVGLFGVTPA